MGIEEPSAYQAAPQPEPWSSEVLTTAIRRYLRAFGPAAAEDIAGWLFWKIPAVRSALQQLGDELLRFSDVAGRTLFDLPESPRPAPDVAAPVRLLPNFDSTLLAYAPKHRTRIVPEAYRGVIYMSGNLILLPTFLVDGAVAGTWATDIQRREATLTLTPLHPLTAGIRKELVAEAERLLNATQPDARAHRVRVAS